MRQSLARAYRAPAPQEATAARRTFLAGWVVIRRASLAGATTRDERAVGVRMGGRRVPLSHGLAGGRADLCERVAARKDTSQGVPPAILGFHEEAVDAVAHDLPIGRDRARDAHDPEPHVLDLLEAAL